MAPQFLTVQNKGIFHSLPTFPEHDGKKYTAIVTGANGLSGSHIVDVLAEAPERWSTIYAMSRRAPASARLNVKNVAADFLGGTPEELAKSFKEQGVTADYIFFASYVQPAPAKGEAIWSNTDVMEKMNVALLENFLKALAIAKVIPKRFLLQTGGKHYALHLGPAAVPMMERRWAINSGLLDRFSHVKEGSTSISYDLGYLGVGSTPDGVKELLVNLKTALRDTTLPLGGGPSGKEPLTIFKGTLVVLSPWSLQRRRDLVGADAHLFNPSRWENWTPKRWEFLPFSHGVRTCPGQKFGNEQVQYIITRIAQEFLELKVAKEQREPMEYKFELNPKPLWPCLVRFLKDKEDGEML